MLFNQVKTRQTQIKLFNNKTLNFLSIKKESKNSIVIIGTDHKNINYKSILKNSKIVFDTRGVLKNNKDKKIIFV